MAEMKFIVFTLSGQKYCIDIGGVKEIITYQNPMELPNTPDFVEGLINLRGEVVSVISLAKRLGKISEIDKEEQKIIMAANHEINTGFLVDDVKEMITANENEISDPPQIIQNNHTGYLTGVVNKEDEMYLIIDINKILGIDEISQLAKLVN